MWPLFLPEAGLASLHASLRVAPKKGNVEAARPLKARIWEPYPVTSVSSQPESTWGGLLSGTSTGRGNLLVPFCNHLPQRVKEKYGLE